LAGQRFAAARGPKDAFMKSIGVALLAAAALLATAAERPSADKLFMRSKPAKHKPVPTTLKGYGLGMTLDAFKLKPAPPNVAGPQRIICSDDPAMQASLGPSLTPKFNGEVICGIQLMRRHDWEAGELMLDAANAATVAFHFFQGKLVQIESEEAADLSNAIVQSLTAQYGDPKQINNRTSQSISNEVRTQVIVTWLNGEDGIVVTAPTLGTNRMSVVYTNLAGFAAMQSSGANLM